LDWIGWRGEGVVKGRRVEGLLASWGSEYRTGEYGLVRRVQTGGEYIILRVRTGTAGPEWRVGTVEYGLGKKDSDR
jgi:hypothetical protein